jgi:biopolymer transport protein ExbD
MPKVMAQPSANEGRGRRGRRTSSTLAEINIIPLVDVMLVLLIVFMVAAPMLQRGVQVNLPVSRQTQKLTEQLVYVTVPLSYRDDRKVYLDDEAISIDFLAERTRQAMLGRNQQSVYLRSDGGVQVQELLQVFDRLKEGGIESVGIVAQQRLEGRGGR